MTYFNCREPRIAESSFVFCLVCDVGSSSSRRRCTGKSRQKGTTAAADLSGLVVSAAKTYFYLVSTRSERDCFIHFQKVPTKMKVLSLALMAIAAETGHVHAFVPAGFTGRNISCLLYTSPSPRD